MRAVAEGATSGLGGGSSPSTHRSSGSWTVAHASLAHVPPRAARVAVVAERAQLGRPYRERVFVPFEDERCDGGAEVWELVNRLARARVATIRAPVDTGR